MKAENKAAKKAEKKAGNKALLEAAQKKIAELSKRLERTDKRKEQAAARRGRGRYHAELKARCYQLLRDGKSFEEIEVLHGVGHAVLGLWKADIKQERNRQASKRMKAKGKRARK